MGRNTTKGTKQLGVEVDAALLDEFRAWLESRAERQRPHVEMALRRHMASPPPPLKPEDPPLPPIGEPAPDSARPKKKGK